MRAVLDPNVIVSALLSSGTTAAVLDAWLERRACEPVICPTLLGELEEVLARPKFSSVGHEVVSGVLERLRTDGDSRGDPEVEAGVTADPGDDYLVALAREAQADCLVSGDPDLHEVNIEDVEVLTPAEFLARLQEL
ncbi:MAG: putative toxin-antitoxin system toxin component, PIN family [Nitrososphaerales archaeon]